MALNYLETIKIVHRDLKPDNVMYSNPSIGPINWDTLHIKVIDFGFAKQTSSNELEEFLGTPYYIAPEITKHLTYGTKCDIWSLGVITYLLLTGEMPFEAKTKE